MVLMISVYTALTLSLFLIVNWIGRHSISRGYRSMELLPRTDEAPALNTAIRVLTPTVFIIIAATALYEIGWGILVSKIYVVAIMYVIFRWAFNIVLDRRLLLNWPKEIILGIIIVFINWGVALLLLKDRTSLLPDRANVMSELWVLMGLYLFYALNQIRIGEDRSIQRKHKHLVSKARKYVEEYDDLVSTHTDNDKLKSLILSVMIYENFNRPRVARVLENLVGKFGISSSFGLMQVTSAHPLTDRESVDLGVKKLVTAWEREKLVHHSYSADYCTAREVIKDYNADDDYISEVQNIAEVIDKHLYKGTQSKLSETIKVENKVLDVPVIPHETGTVIETIHSSGYTYVSVVTKNGELNWLAMPEGSVSIGNEIEYPKTSPLTNFNSKTLNIVFNKVMFIPGVRIIGTDE